MSNSFFLLGFSLALCGFIRFADWRVGVTGLYVVSAVCMALLAVRADVAISIFGLKSNFGNLLYAPVLFGTAYGVLCYGSAIGWKQVKCVFFGLIPALAISVVASANVTGDPPRDATLRVIVPSLLAFTIANAIVILTARKTRSGVLAQLAGQTVDSVIFFPLAYGGVAGFPLLSTMVSGLLIKGAIVIMTWPLFLWRGKKTVAMPAVAC